MKGFLFRMHDSLSKRESSLFERDDSFLEKQTLLRLMKLSLSEMGTSFYEIFSSLCRMKMIILNTGVCLSEKETRTPEY